MNIEKEEILIANLLKRNPDATIRDYLELIPNKELGSLKNGMVKRGKDIFTSQLSVYGHKGVDEAHEKKGRLIKVHGRGA